VQVTAAALPDYEYDAGRDGVPCASCNFGAGNARLVFSDNQQQLWVARVDPQTGNYVPSDGHDLLLDTNATARPTTATDPEWFDSAPARASSTRSTCRASRTRTGPR
jgi:hypothetical protein